MAEYVAREALLKHLQECRETSTGSCPTFAVIAAVQAYVEGMPAADVVPVVHGEWVNVYGDFSVAECSVCESQLEATFDDESNGALWDGFRQFYNYCPACGAKMDGKGEDDGQKD